MLLEEASKVSNVGFSEWSAWSIVVLILFVIFLYESQRKFREKKMIKGYKNYDDERAITYKKNKKSGLKLFGEFLGEFYNETRRCWELRFRSGVAHYFNVFSTDPMAEYMEVHFIENNYWILYSINAQLYRKDLKKSEYYYRKLGYSIQAWIYKGFTFCVNLGSASGIILSLILFGTLFAVIFPNLQGLNFILGCAFGFIMSSTNHILLNHSKTVRNLLKLKKELVKQEYYLCALESPEKVINVYKVKGYQRIEQVTSDGAKTLEEKSLEGNEKVDYIKEKDKKRIHKKKSKKSKKPKKEKVNKKNDPGPEEKNSQEEIEKVEIKKEQEEKTRKLAKQEKFKIKKLKDDETVNYVLIRGYDKLFNMIQNPHVEVKSYELIGQETERKTRQEIRDLRHGYLERNKQFAETIFRLQKENARLQREYVSVREQLHSVEENTDKEIKKMAVRMLKTQEKSRKTIRDIFEELFGDVVGKEWDSKLEAVLRKLETEKQITQMDKLTTLVITMKELIKKIGEKEEIDVGDIMNLLKLKSIETEGEGAIA